MQILNRQFKSVFGLVFLMFITQACNMNTKQNTLTESKILDTLRSNLQLQPEWVKVHIAEFLLWSGHSEGVKEVFLKENELHGDKSTYRIGIWRVLAQVETNQADKKVWTDKILQAYLDENGADRLHAVETLAKLKISPFKQDVKLENLLTADSMDNFQVYKIWSFAYSSEKAFPEVQQSFLDLSLSSTQAFLIRAISAYALKKMGGLDDNSWNTYAQRALAEPVDAPIRVNLLNTAIVTAGKESVKTDLYNEVFANLMQLYDENADNSIKMSVFDALAEKGTARQLDLLNTFFNKTKNAKDAATVDVLASCTYAILKIKERNNK